MKVYGHRGAAALAPENTIDAILAARSSGCDGFECDVRMTADDALVLMHDSELSRTTDGSGDLHAHTLEEVRALDAAFLFGPTGGYPMRDADVRVPTVGEALDAAAGWARAILELKGTPLDSAYDPAEPAARALGELLEKRAQEGVVVSSFNPLALDALRETAPGVETALLISERFDAHEGVKAAAGGGHRGVHPAARLVDATLVTRAHGCGLEVVVWTVDEPELIAAFREWQVDGIISDDPRTALAVLGRA